MAKELLKGIYCFKELKADELTQLEKTATNQRLSHGENVFAQGDKSDSMFVVKYGSVRIKQSTASGEDIAIAVLGSGSHFGEMAFVNRESRTATAEVLEDSEIIRIDFTQLQKLLESNPKIAASFYRSMCIFLSKRLDSTTHDLGFAREKLAARG